MDVTTIAALVFAIAAIGVIAFQLALAFGAPWGRDAMGGALPGRMPPKMRVGEHRIWVPVSSVLLVSSLLIALGA